MPRGRPRTLIGPRRQNGKFYYRRPRRAAQVPNTSKVRNTLGFPDRMLTKLEYRTSGIFNVSATDANYDFRLNSIYDPDKTSTGHQPMWSDQFQAIYQHYRVYKCDYELKLVALSTGGTPARCVTLSSSDVAALPANIVDAWEQNRTGNRLIPSGTDRVTMMKGKLALPRLQGQTSVAFKGDDGNFALFGSNPANDAVLRILFGSVNGNETQYAWEIKLIYHVEMFDRVLPHTS